MTPAELEIMAILTSLFGLGTFTLIGLKMFLTYRAKRLSGGGDEVRKLAETMEDLRRDLADTRAELTDMHERMDFAERILARARDVDRPEGGP